MKYMAKVLKEIVKHKKLKTRQQEATNKEQKTEVIKIYNQG